MISPIPDFPVRDLKFEAITKCAHENWDLPKLKNAALEPVIVSFRSNIARVRFLMLLPTAIAGGMAITQRCHDIAEYEITGQVRKDELSIASEVMKKINPRRVELMEEHQNASLAQRDSPDWDKSVGEFHHSSAMSLKGFTGTPLGAYAFVDIFSAFVTGTWTAIEAMLGDLWEASLNAHPSTLAALKGKPRRIGQADTEPPADRRSAANDVDPKTVPLNLIEMSNFDLRSSMGTVFRRQRRFEFTRLSSIREAYSRAFSEKSGRIDTALAHKSLDALSAVRNVLVHRAGKADAEYIRLSSFLNVPKVAVVGDPVRLDGEIVADLIGRAIASSKSLAIAVDEWVQQN